MAISTVSPLSASPISFEGGDDVLALAQALHDLSAHELRGSARASAAQARGLLAKLGAIKEADLVGKLGQLATVDAGATVVLGSGLASGYALKAEIEAQGFSLSTQERYYYSSVQYDTKGNVIGTAAKILATPAQMTALESAKLESGPTADGTETRSITLPGLGRIVYTLYKGERELTASKTAVNTLVGQINTAQKDLMDAINAAVQLAKGIAQETLLAIQQFGQPFGQALQRGRNAVDTQQADRREASADDFYKRRLERDRLVQDANASPNRVPKPNAIPNASPKTKGQD